MLLRTPFLPAGHGFCSHRTALLLSNLLEALKVANRIPKRFILQTGGKHYAIHIGANLSPMEESHPR